MLPSNVQLELENRWEATRPLNIVRPLIIIDLVTYLLFVKRLDELQAFQDAKAKETARTLENPVFRKEQQELRWSNFKNLDREKLHHLFVKDKGIIDFINDYGKGPHVFSNFLRTPLILKPTPILLENAVSIVKCIHAADADVKGEAYEYLLNKAVITNKSRQLPMPDHIVKMLVSMLEPTPDDIIYDPSVNTGKLLIACASYLKDKQQGTSSGEAYNTSFLSETLIGTEQDPVLMRMAAMNMILSGIEDPQLKPITALHDGETAFSEEATLVLANPPLMGKLHSNETEENTSSLSDSRQTGLMYLTLLLKSLKNGGRAAVVVPESIMLGTSPAHKQMRQNLIDDHKLEGVISMPGGIFRPYSGIGTNILLIKKEAPAAADTVWFYDMQTDGLSLDDKRLPILSSDVNSQTFPDAYGDIPDILARWKTRSHERELEATDKSFFVPVSIIREKGYDLKSKSYNDKLTRPVRKEQPQTILPPLDVVPKQSIEKETILPPVDVVPIKNIQKRSALEELREKTINPVYASGSGNKRSSKVVLASALLLCLAAISSYFVFVKNDGVDTNVLAMQTTTKPEAQQEESIDDKEFDSASLTDVKDDEASINILDAKVGDDALVNGASIENAQDDAYSGEAKINAIQVANTPKRVRTVRYTVMSNAAFYDAPTEASRRSSPILYANNSFGPLKAVEERNGFVYVEVTNKNSETFKGWLRKKDLKKTIVNSYDSDIK